MPSFGYGTPINYKRWYACLTKVAQQMINEGCNKHARKFSEVQKRRASKLYRGVTV